MDAFLLSPIEWVVILTSLTSGAIGALGIGGYLYWRDRTRRRQQRTRQQRHLEQLQRLTSILLNALDLLLGGASPQETSLYRRFKALGGEYYADLQAGVSAALHDGRSALAVARDLHQKLIDPDASAGRTLEQRLWDWEKLYAALIGPGEHIQNLSGDELQALLDPQVEPALTPDHPELAASLDELRREPAGQPLKVRWQQFQPSSPAADGILDVIHRLKTLLAQLPERHKQEAPFWLVEARSQRQQAERDIPPFLPELYRHIVVNAGQTTPGELTPGQIFRDIDMRLAETEAAQTMGRFSEVIERSHDIWRDMDILRSFLRALNEHGRRVATLETLTAAGYCPPRLAEILQAIRVEVQTITGRLHAADYLGAGPWIEELNTDSPRALAEALAWQALHRQNVANLDQLRARVAGRQDDVTPAWEKLQNYARPTWSDLAPGVEQARQAFRLLQHEQYEQIQSLNSLEVQKLVEAERLLVYAAADLAVIEQQFQAVGLRLVEVQAAAACLPEALRLAEADLRRAETRRDPEAGKIGPEIDRQIEQARQHLTEAQRLAEAGGFLAAVNEQFTARQLAAAYMSASEEGRELDTRQTQLDTLVRRVKPKIEQCLSEARQVAVTAQTFSTGRLARQLPEALLTAEQARLAAAELEDQALVRALNTAITAYIQVEQQAEWVGRQLTADQAGYDQALNRTLASLAEAEAAIEQARPAATGAVGQHAWQRARAALPSRAETEQAGRAALDRLAEQAEAAIRYARWAENQVHRHSRLAQGKVHLHQPEPEKDQDHPPLKRLRQQTALDQPDD
ncbi:MAG: hypothetical protein AB1801_05455 [Chloroflexota bacterium]